VRILSLGLLFAATAAAGFGCSAEHFGGEPDAAPAATGGIGAGSGGIGPSGDETGGTGSGGDGIGGMGTGGASTDAASDLEQTTDADVVRDVAIEGDHPVVRDGSDEAPDRAADAGRDAATCVNGIMDLSNVGTGDFHISFRIVTTQPGWAALLNQRSACNFVVFWDIRQADGNVTIETGANTIYQDIRSTTKVNDGGLHDVEVARVSGALTIRIDGAISGAGPSTASLGTLAPLRVGSDICGPTNNPPTAVQTGTISNVCITKP
jgi:hypothetical protein